MRWKVSLVALVLAGLWSHPAASNPEQDAFPACRIYDLSRKCFPGKSRPDVNARAWVTDATGSTDCTTGGGTTLNLCRFNGAAWVDETGLGSATPTPAGNDTNVQTNQGGVLSGDDGFVYSNGVVTLSGGVAAIRVENSVEGLLLDPDTTTATRAYHIQTVNGDSGSDPLNHNSHIYLDGMIQGGIPHYLVARDTPDTLDRKTIQGGLQGATRGTSATYAGDVTVTEQYNILGIRRHATNCQAVTDGKAGELCSSDSSQLVFECQPIAGDCDQPIEWVLTSVVPPRSGYRISSNFPSADTTNVDGWKFTATGSGSASLGVTATANHINVIDMTTGSAGATDSEKVTVVGNTTILLQGSGSVRMDAVVLTGASVADDTDKYKIKCGFANTTASAESTSAAYIELDSAAGNSGFWRTRFGSGTPSAAATTTAAAAATWYRLTITGETSNGSSWTKFRAYVNGVELSTSPFTSSLPTAAMAPFCGVFKKAGTTAEQTMSLDSLDFTLLYNTPL